MARTKAISILSGESAPADLAELYGLVIENVRKSCLSQALKSNNYTGNPKAGSVEFKRFANAESKDYGTARAANKGNKITAPPVTVNIDQRKEIVEEVSKSDLDAFGVTNLMQRRADNHVMSMQSKLDTDFFSAAAGGATSFTPSATAIHDIVESFIQTLETVKNDFTDGVDRVNIDVVLSPAKYGLMRDFLDTQSNPNVDTAAEEFGVYHGVKVFSSTRLPSDVNGICMVRGAVAQPCVVDQYSEPEKIPLSNDYACSLFYNYGTKLLTPDLAFVWKNS